MHFRVRGNNVQIVRSETDPATNKAKSQPIGSASLKTGEISATALAALTPAEVVEAQTWLARQRDLEHRRRELEFDELPGKLAALRDWVRQADPAQVDPARDEVMRSLGRLRAALAGRRGRREETDAAATAEAA